MLLERREKKASTYSRCALMKAPGNRRMRERQRESAICAIWPCFKCMKAEYASELNYSSAVAVKRKRERERAAEEGGEGGGREEIFG